MAPKRGDKIVVRSTRKLVQQTVQVSVVSSSKRSTKANPETQEDEEGNSPTQEQEHVRTIPVQEVTPEGKTEQEEEDTQKGEKQIKKSGTETEGKDGHGGGDKGTKRKRKRGGRSSGEGYRRYVHRVLKQVHPNLGISFQAMTILNNLMSDMFERLADEATRLKTYTGHMTLSSREIQGAVKLVLPGELGRHAIAEGAKAVTTYMSNDARK